MDGLDVSIARGLQSLQEALNLPDRIAGNSFEQLASACVVFLGAFVAYMVLRWIVVKRVAAIASRWSEDGGLTLEKLVQATRTVVFFIVSLYLASLVLTLQPKAVTVVRAVTIIALLIQGAIWGNVLVTFGITQFARRRLEHDADTYTTVSAIGWLGRVALWSVVVLLILANLGVDVTALVAGLGVGGIAVALAAQNILGDLFASLSIVLDKPFVLGDFISVGNEMGTVQQIGLKTTRVRSLSGEQLVFSNNDLLQSRIRNFKRMEQRRVVFTIGVTYGTPQAQLAAIPAVVRTIIEQGSGQTRFDRAHLHKFSELALQFEVVYYVLSPDFNLYMDIQQRINFALIEHFERERIEFAHYAPQQVVATLAP